MEELVDHLNRRRNDLTEKQQDLVRAALRFLRRRDGGWAPVAAALRYQRDSIDKIVNGRRNVTPTLALRVARFVGASFDDLINGHHFSPRTCRHCGHPPDDFVDEETQVQDLGEQILHVDFERGGNLRKRDRRR